LISAAIPRTSRTIVSSQMSHIPIIIVVPAPAVAKSIKEAWGVLVEQASDLLNEDEVQWGPALPDAWTCEPLRP
jgi:hypothetical protein